MNMNNLIWFILIPLVVSIVASIIANFAHKPLEQKLKALAETRGKIVKNKALSEQLQALALSKTNNAILIMLDTLSSMRSSMFLMVILAFMFSCFSLLTISLKDVDNFTKIFFLVSAIFCHIAFFILMMKTKKFERIVNKASLATVESEIKEIATYILAEIEAEPKGEEETRNPKPNSIPTEKNG